MGFGVQWKEAEEPEPSMVGMTIWSYTSVIYLCPSTKDMNTVNTKWVKDGMEEVAQSSILQASRQIILFEF